MSSKIEWTEDTWNPLAGCSLVSAGCKNCYAMKMAWRLEHMGQQKYVGTTEKTEGGNIRWTGKINLDEAALMKPLNTKKPTTYFVNSMSDLFHAEVPFDFIDKVFAVMALTPQHTYQVLTKRPERLLEYFTTTMISGVMTKLDSMGDEYNEAGNEEMMEQCCDASADIFLGRWPLKNVWLGTSVEDQKAADERIPYLLQVPAAVRFLSCEPLLGPVDIRQYIFSECPDCEGSMSEFIYDTNDEVQGGKACSTCINSGQQGSIRNLHWVIAGGESGNGARAMHPDWVRSLRDQCAGAGVPFFFKQWGAWLPWQLDEATGTYKSQDGLEKFIRNLFPDDGHCLMTDNDMNDGSKDSTCLFERVGKNAAGRLLDGVEHNGMPKTGTV